MLPKACRVVSPKVFEVVFREEAQTAEFASPEEKDAYAKRDAFLVYLIRKELKHLFGTDEERQLFVGDDWWPDHTRHIEATPAYCTAAFFTALQSLLIDEYKNYRIQIIVYGNLLDGKSYIGSMALYADRVLIGKELHELLQRNKTTL